MRMCVTKRTTHLYLKIVVKSEPIPSKATFFLVPCLPLDVRKEILNQIARLSILECRAFSMTNKEMYKVLEPFLIKHTNPFYNMKYTHGMKVRVIYQTK